MFRWNVAERVGYQTVICFLISKNNDASAMHYLLSFCKLSCLRRTVFLLYRKKEWRQPSGWLEKIEVWLLKLNERPIVCCGLCPPLCDSRNYSVLYSIVLTLAYCHLTFDQAYVPVCLNFDEAVILPSAKVCPKQRCYVSSWLSIHLSIAQKRSFLELWLP